MNKDDPGPAPPPELLESCSRCIDWYAEGETRVIEVGGVKILVRFVGRHGRRGRIAITAPPGAMFSTLDM
jgi:hypothetical protein